MHGWLTSNREHKQCVIVCVGVVFVYFLVASLVSSGHCISRVVASHNVAGAHRLGAEQLPGQICAQSEYGTIIGGIVIG